jgi:hypothetical protein
LRPKRRSVEGFCFSNGQTISNSPVKESRRPFAVGGFYPSILNDITKVKKISRRFAFKAKADSSNRHQRTRYRSPQNFQKPNVIQYKWQKKNIAPTLNDKGEPYAEIHDKTEEIRRIPPLGTVSFLRVDIRLDIFNNCRQA